MMARATLHATRMRRDAPNDTTYGTRAHAYTRRERRTYTPCSVVQRSTWTLPMLVHASLEARERYREWPPRGCGLTSLGGCRAHCRPRAPLRRCRTSTSLTRLEPAAWRGVSCGRQGGRAHRSTVEPRRASACAVMRPCRGPSRHSGLLLRLRLQKPPRERIQRRRLGCIRGRRLVHGEGGRTDDRQS